MRLRVQPVVFRGIIRAMDTTDRRALQLGDPGMRAWARFLHAHATIVRRLEAELQGERDLGLGEFEALLQLSLADMGRLRMSELADRLVLSRSGVTRLVDRLEAAGLVARVTCPSDARGSFAELTDAGLARLHDAAPTHVRGVREHFVDSDPRGRARRAVADTSSGSPSRTGRRTRPARPCSRPPARASASPSRPDVPVGARAAPTAPSGPSATPTGAASAAVRAVSC